MTEKKFGKHGALIGAIDEGTSSTRFMVFSTKNAELIATHQLPIQQLHPKNGWVEQDPVEILNNVKQSINGATAILREGNINPQDIVAIGVTNQRETTVLWDKFTGEPLYNTIVWLDTRTTETITQLLSNKSNKSKNQLKSLCGLPINPYFSSVKIKWLIDNIPRVKEAIENDRCLFGTIDTWIIWNLTGGPKKGIHITDVTNASCTMLMNLDTGQWDSDLCNFFEVPMKILPQIRSCSEIYGFMECTDLKGIPISGCVGDQQAALMGQLCFEEGGSKCTYGTGCFLLCNTGRKKVYSKHGLLTTIAYKLGPEEPLVYALEGSVAIAGAAFRWLKDNMKLIKSTDEVNEISTEVEDTNGVYFVPAFSGLYAPYWDPNARGVICGLAADTDYKHIIRATVEAICYQTRDVLEAMDKDSGFKLKRLKVDGGMTINGPLMQLQTDILGIAVEQPTMIETTCLGAAIAAGMAKGIQIWDPKSIRLEYKQLQPNITEHERNQKYARWKMAIERSLGWKIENEGAGEPNQNTNSPV